MGTFSNPHFPLINRFDCTQSRQLQYSEPTAPHCFLWPLRSDVLVGFRRSRAQGGKEHINCSLITAQRTDGCPQSTRTISSETTTAGGRLELFRLVASGISLPSRNQADLCRQQTGFFRPSSDNFPSFSRASADLRPFEPASSLTAKSIGTTTRPQPPQLRTSPMRIQ